MKRIALIAVVLLVAFFAGRRLVLALVAEETKIQWLIEDMVAGFNDGHAGRAVEGLAEDWQHFGSTIDRRSLQAALFQEFRSFGQSGRGGEVYRVQVPAAGLEIAVEGRAATAAGEAEFARERDGRWETVWRLRFEAQLVDGEQGWRIHTSRHEDLVGWGLR